VTRLLIEQPEDDELEIALIENARAAEWPTSTFCSSAPEIPAAESESADLWTAERPVEPLPAISSVHLTPPIKGLLSQ
jgi:hypothetical protein